MNGIKLIIGALILGLTLGFAARVSAYYYVCGVHYDTVLEEAKKHFLGARFQGIHNFRYSGKGVLHCNPARDEARKMQGRNECSAFYQGDSDLSIDGGRCQIYLFEAEHYIGDPGSFHHPSLK